MQDVATMPIEETAARRIRRAVIPYALLAAHWYPSVEDELAALGFDLALPYAGRDFPRLHYWLYWQSMAEEAAPC